MKKLAFFLLILSFSFNGIIAQPPGELISNNGFNYQTIIRDSLGNILKNKAISIKIKLTINPNIDSDDYEETFNVTTNNFGLVNLIIGRGNVIKGDFNTLVWSQTYSIIISFDAEGGSKYKLLGSSILMSVPYAFYARNSGTPGPTGPTGATGSIDGAWLTTGNPNINSSTNYLGTTNANNIIFKTNNTERMSLLSSGQVVYNNTTNKAGDVFSVYTSGITTDLGLTAISGYGTGSNSIGVYGQSDDANGFGVYARNTNLNGTGFAARGNNLLTVDLVSYGSGGAFAGTKLGLYSYATDTLSGTGVLGVGMIGIGNNSIPPSLPLNGCGGAFNADYIGVYGQAKKRSRYPISEGSWGGVFVTKGVYANVAGWSFDFGSLSWMNYKILGTGAVSTIADDTKGNEVIMFCPEAPEVLLQDKGEGQLIKGRTHISIDEIFTKNIVVDEKHPLSVLIQPEGDCKGVYVTNKNSSGFDVVELNSGTSDIKFTWFVMASRADKTYTNKDGTTMTSSFSKVRFPKNNSRIETKELEIKKADTQGFIKRRR